MRPWLRMFPGAFALLLIGAASGVAQRVDAGTAAGSEAAAVPEGHTPKVESEIAPTSIAVGETASWTLKVTVPHGDDVTLPEQTFSPLEVIDKVRTVDTGATDTTTFVFKLSLLAFEDGPVALDQVRLRVVTEEGQVFEQTAPPMALTVTSLIGNEPNAEPKPSTQPVDVMEDNLTPLYLLAGLLFAVVVAALTVWLQRYLASRKQEAAPPPPPRPPWEIAVEELAELRRRKQDMVAAGQAVEFVDRVSDVVREYLGRCFHFHGLDTTTAELLDHLRLGRAPTGLQEESRDYLRRCDLVKFAKVEPDQDEVDLIFAKAQDIVQFSMPAHASRESNQGAQP